MLKEIASENSSTYYASKGSELTRSTVYKKDKKIDSSVSRATNDTKQVVIGTNGSLDPKPILYLPATQQKKESRVIMDMDLEIEASGDFSDIDVNDMSQRFPDSDDDENYIRIPQLEDYIGPDWSGVEISSDIEENEQYANSRTKLSCNICTEQFKCKMELQAHELEHENTYLFKCQIPGCNNRYK